MQQYLKNYLTANGLTPGDWILCQHCEIKEAVDVHHIQPRSKFGKKTRSERDSAENLIALCRTCHNKAHDNEISKEKLFGIVQKALFNNNRP